MQLCWYSLCLYNQLLLKVQLQVIKLSQLLGQHNILQINHHHDNTVCNIRITKSCLEPNNCCLIYSKCCACIYHASVLYSWLERVSWPQMHTMSANYVAHNPKGHRVM